MGEMKLHIEITIADEEIDKLFKRFKSIIEEGQTKESSQPSVISGIHPGSLAEQLFEFMKSKPYKVFSRKDLARHIVANEKQLGSPLHRLVTGGRIKRHGVGMYGYLKG